jgi:type I restriction enzyme, S subunit
VVVAIRATIGKALPVPPELDGANLTQGTAKVSPGSRITTDYLLASLQSESAQLQFGSLAKGTTFMEITLDMLRKFKIPLPPKYEQGAILDYLKNQLPRFDRMHSAYTRQLELLTEYRAALIHECVTGQRAVPN